MAGIPVIHPLQNVLRLACHQARAFGKNIQLGAGDNGGDFQDYIPVWLKARHFEINPNEIRVGFPWHIGFAI